MVERDCGYMATMDVRRIRKLSGYEQVSAATLDQTVRRIYNSDVPGSKRLVRCTNGVLTGVVW